MIAPLSEIHGRLSMYMACLAGLIVFNLGCAFSTSLPMLLTFRFLSGLFGSAPQVLGAGTIADLMRDTEKDDATTVSTTYL